MQAGNTDRRKGFADNRHPKAGTLIKLCKPPIMGNTIAAVFLCLSAVSVKGFLSVRLLSALFLQLPEPVSDALPFGRFLRSAFFLNLSLPLGKTAVVLCYNGFRFSVCCHKRLHIGITVLFQNVGQFIRPFGATNVFIPYALMPYYGAMPGFAKLPQKKNAAISKKITTLL